MISPSIDETIDAIARQLEAWNAAYRAGNPIVDDGVYDDRVEQLRALAPDHPFLQAVEPEPFSDRQKVRHPTPMLSIEKAYNREQLERFAARVQKEADAPEALTFRLTPKLDGLAGRDDGTVFATRGNGLVGYEISSAFDKGVIPIGGRGQGVGEIVVIKSWFDKELSDLFEHPRNMVVGIVSSDTLNENAKIALEKKKVHFVPYIQLPSLTVSATELVNDYPRLTQALLEKVDYPTDGVVAAVTDEMLKAKMGATAHHYRWQIAIKTRGETADTTVESVEWQVGRTGNITPVLRVSPVSLSGATIRRVTAHHAGNIRDQHIGTGTRIRIIRSGEVIPKLEAILESHGDIAFPDVCPSCGKSLSWQNDFLKCANPDCRAQVAQRIHHWFKMLGNADWFGIKTIQRIVENGRTHLEDIYTLSETDFIPMGFGPVQSKNLADALSFSRSRKVEDWRFLAAFGISNLGAGDSRKLLSHFSIESLLDATADDIQKIKGFGEITSEAIAADLSRLRPLIRHMLQLGFNLERTPLTSETRVIQTPISGKNIVFTGKMIHGNREAMQTTARSLGAIVQTAVSRATDYLVCGEKVGAAKMDKADRLGVKVISEAEYAALIEPVRRADT